MAIIHLLSSVIKHHRHLSTAISQHQSSLSTMKQNQPSSTTVNQCQSLSTMHPDIIHHLSIIWLYLNFKPSFNHLPTAIYRHLPAFNPPIQVPAVDQHGNHEWNHHWFRKVSTVSQATPCPYPHHAGGRSCVASWCPCASAVWLRSPSRRWAGWTTDARRASHPGAPVPWPGLPPRSTCQLWGMTVEVSQSHAGSVVTTVNDG